MQVRIEVTAGPQKGAGFDFTEQGVFILGRGDDCHLTIKDGFVSRHHFMIEAAPPQAVLRDMGSKNGTWLNGRKLSRPEADNALTETADGIGVWWQHLSDGDVIQLGKTRLVISIEQPNEPIPEDEPDGSNEFPDVKIAELDSRPEAVEPQPDSVSSAPPADESGMQGFLQKLIKELMAGKPAGQEPRIPDFELLEKIGQGGMGAVYRARHIKTGGLAAVKVVLLKKSRGQARDRFRREARLTAMMDHPNIVKLYDSNYHKGVLFIAMEYVPLSLERLMADSGGRLDLATALPIMKSAVKGMRYAHEQGLIHRDLKPGNILLDGQPPVYTAKICDLGMAKSLTQTNMTRITRTGDIAGTLPYIAPDQILRFKEALPAFDIFGLGATFFHMLTGRPVYPFTRAGDPVAVILRQGPMLMQQVDPGCGQALADVIDKACSAAPETRYADMSGFLAALNGLG